MRKKKYSGLRLGLAFLFALEACGVMAFAEQTVQPHTFEVSGLVRGFGVYGGSGNPGVSGAEEENSLESGGALRFVLQGDRGEQFSYEINLFQSYLSDGFAKASVLGRDVERSDALTWSLSDAHFVTLTVDQAKLNWQGVIFDHAVNVVIGRQAINLANTFFFTPNDFFAPFAAQNFYRVYKSGVDGVKADVELGPLSQISALYVLGYEADLNSETGWSNASNARRQSVLLRFSTVAGDFEWGLLAGDVLAQHTVGFSLQGELWQWLGVRSEGHWASPDNREFSDHVEISIGVEHRWENSLNGVIEYYYHGAGVDSKAQYIEVNKRALSSPLALAPGPGIAYLAKHYLALSGSYEISPLLLGQMLVLNNRSDRSYLLLFDFVYSLADESEVVLNVRLPGDGARGSEFGAIPDAVSLELKYFF